WPGFPENGRQRSSFRCCFFTPPSPVCMFPAFAPRSRAQFSSVAFSSSEKCSRYIVWPRRHFFFSAGTRTRLSQLDFNSRLRSWAQLFYWLILFPAGFDRLARPTHSYRGGWCVVCGVSLESVTNRFAVAVEFLLRGCLVRCPWSCGVFI